MLINRYVCTMLLMLVVIVQAMCSLVHVYTYYSSIHIQLFEFAFTIIF